MTGPLKRSLDISIKNYIPLVLIVLGFILAKLSQLSLPHYWDEAWSYATAIQKMYESGPTLLPGIIDVDATRGHPLFFYAAASSWMKIFGASLVSKHSFALFISLLLLIAIYEFCYRLYNKRVAIISTLLFATQIFFFVQSSMLFPEVMVTLFILASIYFFIAKKYLALAASLSLLFLTKESGLVLGIILGFAFIISLFDSDYSRQQKIKLFAALLFPALIIGGFFILQKSNYGWYFFPEHIGLIDVDRIDFSARIQSSISIIFIEEKRKWIWRMLCVLAVFYAIREKKYSVLLVAFGIALTFALVYFDLLKIPLIATTYLILLLFSCIWCWYQAFNIQRQKMFIAIAAAFSIAYLIFCCLNFFSARYLMPVLLFSLILFTIWLDRFISNVNLKLYLPFGMIVIALSVQSYLKNNVIGDTGLGSYNAIKVQQATIQYLVNQQAQKKQIATGSFLQKINMQNPACGFIKNLDQQFLNVRWDIDSSTHYVIFDSMEPDNRYQEIKTDSSFQLVYQVKKENVWAEIFKRNE